MLQIKEKRKFNYVTLVLLVVVIVLFVLAYFDII
jgi:hypothetical protein